MGSILIGKIGDDMFRRFILDVIESNYKKLLKQLIVSKEDYSSYTFILSSADSDQVLLHYPGVNGAFSMQDINFAALKRSKIFREFNS